jgi:hypothetical protein
VLRKLSIFCAQNGKPILFSGFHSFPLSGNNLAGHDLAGESICPRWPNSNTNSGAYLVKNSK